MSAARRPRRSRTPSANNNSVRRGPLADAMPCTRAIRPPGTGLGKRAAFSAKYLNHPEERQDLALDPLSPAWQHPVGTVGPRRSEAGLRRAVRGENLRNEPFVDGEQPKRRRRWTSTPTHLSSPETRSISPRTHPDGLGHPDQRDRGSAISGSRMSTAQSPRAPLTIGSVFRWQTAGLDMKSTVEEVDPPRRIVWGGPAQGSSPFTSGPSTNEAMEF